MKYFFQKQFLRNSKTVISKTVSEIGKMYEIKLVGLLIYSKLLSRHILIPPTVFDIQGFEKSQKTPPV